MSEDTTTGGGYGKAEGRRAVTQGPGELDGSESGSTLASANGPDAPRVQWTHPMCEDCWITTQGLDKHPHRLRSPEPERCCWCGRATEAGIYFRADSGRLAHHPVSGHDE